MTTITTRAGKGTTLSHTELDANFTNLNADKVEKSTISKNVVAFSLERTSVGTVGNYMANGNGSTGIKGLRMPFAGKILAATLHGTLITGTITIQAAINGTQNASFELTGTGSATDVNATADWTGAPLSFAAGDLITFYQAAVPTVANGYVATMFVSFN